MPTVQLRGFLLLLLAATIAFAWILFPFWGAVFWAAVLALLFAPFHRYVLRRTGGRRNIAALITLFTSLVGVILPVTWMGVSLVREGALLFVKLKSGQVDLAMYFQHIISVLPAWALDLLERLGLDDLASLREKLTAAAAQGAQMIASHVFSIGQDTFAAALSVAMMLYLLFFFLRDGAELSRQIRNAVPLNSEHKRHLIGKVATVVRATVKGNIAVAATQGALGGLIFWLLGLQGALLWGVIMGFLSLLPAIGAGLIWLPVALYFLATGQVAKGAILIAYGVLVIGLVDNLLRPILVGKDTQMPDYLVLISTLGGLTVFGLNGFVIGPLIAALFIAVWDLYANLEK
jgi:predicted PurR-regulated permease PerM